MAFWTSFHGYCRHRKIVCVAGPGCWCDIRIEAVGFGGLSLDLAVGKVKYGLLQ